MLDDKAGKKTLNLKGKNKKTQANFLNLGKCLKYTTH